MDIFSDASSAATNPFAADPPSIPHTSLLTLNIAGFVCVKLQLSPPNFTLLSTYFDAAIQSFGLVDHVDSTVDARQRRSDVMWTQLDWCIVRWLYGTVYDEIVATIRVDNPTALVLYTAINTLFRSNRNQQGVQALEEFHCLYQGDLSIQEYCTRLKTLADTLVDCRLPQSDHAIVTNLIRGLSRKFDHAIGHLTYDDTRMPTFLQARSYLLREERRLAHLAAHETATALYAGRAPAVPPSAPSAPQQQQQPPTQGGQRGRKRRKGGNPGAPPPVPHGQPAAQRPPAPAPSPGFNPWTGTFQAWPVQPRPTSAGVLGPRPAFGLTAVSYGPPPAASYGAPPAAYPAGFGAPTPYGLRPPCPLWRPCCVRTSSWRVLLRHLVGHLCTTASPPLHAAATVFRRWRLVPGHRRVLAHGFRSRIFTPGWWCSDVTAPASFIHSTPVHPPAPPLSLPMQQAPNYGTSTLVTPAMPLFLGF